MFFLLIYALVNGGGKMKKKIISLILASGLAASTLAGGCAYKCTHDFVYDKLHITTNDSYQSNNEVKTYIK